MPEQLLQFDRTLFYLINSIWTHPLLDVIMPWLRNKYLWTPLYLFLIAFMTMNYGKRGVLALIYLGLVVLFCDQLSSDILKSQFERVRPCNNPIWGDHIRVLVNCGTGYSFPSSHAANHFGTAFFLGILVWKRSRIILQIAILWALVVSYAQVYVGVHFPLDIAGGAVVGIILGTLLSLLCKRHLKNDF